MKGRVKIFKDDKGYGFILGEDGYDYFCHISEIRSMDMPTTNSVVEFEPSSLEKGRKAVNVNVIQRFEQRPEFINLGHYRIKTSKIKEYNTSKRTTKECVYRGGLFERAIYADIDRFYLYITMFDGSYYTIEYKTKEELNDACEILDKLLGTVNL